MTSIAIFDGTDTIGGNKIYVEENHKGVFLDFRMNFKKYNYFYRIPNYEFYCLFN
jgi:ribonuclease J